jgi:5,10-methenyltetrahydrofolate synthetase
MPNREHLRKSQLRTDLSQKRKDQLLKMKSARAGVESQICGRVSDLLQQLHVHTVASFRNLPEEVNLWSLRDILPNHTFVFPKVYGSAMNFHVGKTNADFKVGPFDILEPSGQQQIDATKVDAFVVPGIGFDRKGYRLGFGKGYYDRVVAGLKGIKIGVGFKFQVENYDLPREDHDVPLDFLVTEDFVLQFGTNKIIEGLSS